MVKKSSSRKSGAQKTLKIREKPFDPPTPPSAPPSNPVPLIDKPPYGGGDDDQ
jgi:hypothetical protein